MGAGIMKSLSAHLGLATVTNLEGCCRVTNVSLGTGTFTKPGHFKGTAALRTGIRGKDNLKVKRSGFLFEVLHPPEDIQYFQK